MLIRERFGNLNPLLTRRTSRLVILHSDRPPPQAERIPSSRLQFQRLNSSWSLITSILLENTNPPHQALLFSPHHHQQPLQWFRGQKVPDSAADWSWMEGPPTSSPSHPETVSLHCNRCQSQSNRVQNWFNNSHEHLLRVRAAFDWLIAALSWEHR